MVINKRNLLVIGLMFANLSVFAVVDPETALKKTEQLKKSFAESLRIAGDSDAHFLYQLSSTGLPKNIFCIIPNDQGNGYILSRANEEGMDRRQGPNIVIRDDEKKCAILLRNKYETILMDAEKSEPRASNDFFGNKELLIYNIDNIQVGTNPVGAAFIVTSNSTTPIKEFFAKLNSKK